MTTLFTATEKFKRWFIDDALPLWIAHGYDRKRGGFYEALKFNATPSVNRPRRVRVQARQIHTFSQAGARGWNRDSERLAAKGFDYFLDKACPDGGARGCAHLLDDDGAILDDKRDLYDQAFLLLACASRWHAAKDDRALALANKTIAFLDHELASPHGGWLESDHKELPRRQNPHMHLFEAFMALYRATGDDRYFAKARNVSNDCFPAFYSEREGVIIEFFGADLGRSPTHIAIEPGHMFEWIWLLYQWEQVSGVDFSDVRNTLYAHGIKLGEDPKFFGFVSNQIDVNTSCQRSAKRLWPQTEYIKAGCVMGKAGDEHALSIAARLIEDMFSTYLNVENTGLWVDEFDADGAPISGDVPASILYHLFEAVAETQTLNQVEGAK